MFGEGLAGEHLAPCPGCGELIAGGLAHRPGFCQRAREMAPLLSRQYVLSLVSDGPSVALRCAACDVTVAEWPLLQMAFDPLHTFDVWVEIETHHQALHLPAVDRIEGRVTSIEDRLESVDDRVNLLEKIHEKQAMVEQIVAEHAAKLARLARPTLPPKEKP